MEGRTKVDGGRRSTFCLVVRGAGVPGGFDGSVAYEMGVSFSSEDEDEDESLRCFASSEGGADEMPVARTARDAIVWIEARSGAFW